jgi:hypothetical protein
MTMSNRRAFRPQVTEILEDRLVPSLASIPTPTILLGRVVPLPPQVQVQANPQMQAAFDAFIRSYTQAVDHVLLGPPPGGLVDPSANRPAFDAAVKQALGTLASNLVASLGNVSANSTLAAQIYDAIVGDSPGSLESQLLALSTSAIAQNSALSSLTSDATRIIQQTSSRLTTMVEAQTPSLVAEAQAATVNVIPAILDISAPDSHAQTLSEIRLEFGAFLSDYFRAVRDLLLAPGPDGRVDVAANRTEFDAWVNSALTTLSDNASRSLSSGSFAPSLSTRVQETIVAGNSGSLAERLDNLPGPSGSEGSQVRAFTLAAFRAIIDIFSVISAYVSPVLTPSTAA